MELVIKKENLQEYNQLIDKCIAVISELSFSQAMPEIEKQHKVGELITNPPLKNRN